jgi:hypothetical protein
MFSVKQLKIMGDHSPQTLLGLDCEGAKPTSRWLQFLTPLDRVHALEPRGVVKLVAEIAYALE